MIYSYTRSICPQRCSESSLFESSLFNLIASISVIIRTLANNMTKVLEDILNVFTALFGSSKIGLRFLFLK